MLNQLNNTHIKLLLGIFIICLVGVGSMMYRVYFKTTAIKMVQTPLITPIKENPYLVHVAGAVASPGVYEIKKGTRVNEVIETAGGPLENAQLASLNLAKKLRDGQKVTVPYMKSPKKDFAIDKELPQTKRVSINDASIEELVRVPYIGEKMAITIELYRQDHGTFQSLDQLIEIKGIGPKKLAKLKPYLDL